jgi:hypothetical protein
LQRAVRDDDGNERWPGIVSRFQLVLLAEPVEGLSIAQAARDAQRLFGPFTRKIQ